jgi:tetratricopeptide (TPR) repeat protein
MVVEAIGGTGKSALTWEWTRLRASDVVRGLAGQLWWSFYDGSASIAAFLRELLLYVSDLPADEIGRLKRQELSDHALSALRAKPYLVVLDGFERLLTAYHRFDPTRLRDDEVPEKRSLIEPHAEDVVRSLVGAGPSKVLISTRLMPDALEGRFNHRMPGVRHMLLPGLSDTDTVKLLAELGVSGDRRAIARFFKPLDNHPLLIGTVAGLVRDYRHDPGAFDSWVCDANAGGALALPDLKQRRAHILEAAFAGLAPEHRRLLGWISEYPGPIAWPTLVEINPFFDEPRPIGRDRVSSRHVHAESLLIPALSDLGDRGLLWWDRSSNSYDLHPIVRAYIEEQLDDDDRVAANERVRDHFQALPPENLESATSVEDVRRTIAIFTALVRAGRTEEACTIWSSRLWNVLALKVGACATVVELLDPPWIREEDEIRTHYGIALLQLGRYEEAIAHVASVLGDTTARRSFQAVRVALLNLDEALRMAGKHASSSRCLELLTALATATRERPEGNLWLARAQHATIVGRYAEARELLRDAEAMGPPVNAPWFVGDVQLERLELILLTGAGQLSEWRIVQAEAELDLWLHRRRIAGLRRAYFLCEERFEQALEAALAVERFERNAGVESTPAGSAFPLAKLGRVEEATVAIEESLARFDRLHRAARPDYELARALQVLGRLDEATFHARMAYTTAWGEGPPYAHHSSLRRAQELLDQLGEAQPDLPTVDRETIRIPHEAKVRNFIAGLATQYWRPG